MDETSPFNSEPEPPCRLVALLFLAVGLMFGIGGTFIYVDYVDAHHQPREHEALIIGNGLTLKAPGVSVLLGAAAVKDGYAGLPVYVADNDGKEHVLTCLVLDEKKRLVAGGGISVPPKFTGTDLHVALGRNIEAGSLQCQLVKP